MPSVSVSCYSNPLGERSGSGSAPSGSRGRPDPLAARPRRPVPGPAARCVSPPPPSPRLPSPLSGNARAAAPGGAGSPLCCSPAARCPAGPAELRAAPRRQPRLRARRPAESVRASTRCARPAPRPPRCAPHGPARPPPPPPSAGPRTWEAAPLSGPHRPCVLQSRLAPRQNAPDDQDQNHRAEPAPHVRAVRRVLHRRDDHHRVPALL